MSGQQRTSMGAGTLRHGSSSSHSSHSHPGGAGAGAGTMNGTENTYDSASSPSSAAAAERHPNPCLTPAQRLIERYERLNTPPPPQTPPSERSTFRREYRTDDASASVERRYSAGTGALRTPLDAESHRTSGSGMKKDRSPIRQSLKNLFSVLKKGAGGLTKKRPEERESLLALGAAGVGLAGAVHPYSEDSVRGINKALPPLADASGRPKKKMTGSLHYLTHSSSSPDSISWAACSVTLEPETHKLQVSSFTPASGNLPGEGMELHIHEIALSRCVNIRSLSTAQLTSKEAQLLLEEGGTQGIDALKVFEILFEEGSGRSNEKFAARSVRERAGWIGAIWDAILPIQDAKEYRPRTDQIQDAACAPSVCQQPVKYPVSSPRSDAPVSPTYLERSLPALPPKSPISPPATLPLSLPPVAPLFTPKKGPSLHLDLSEFKTPISPPHTSQRTSHNRGQLTPSERVISPSIYPPTSRPVSTFIASPISPTSGLTVGSGSPCPNSPSIRNLSQLSVVRQRLAQIERNHSELSAESRYSSACTTPTSGPVSPAGSGWSKREAVFYNAGTRTGVMSRSSSKAGSSKVVSPLNQVSTPDFSRKTEDSGQGKDDVTPKAKSQHKSKTATDSTPTWTMDLCSKDDMRKLSREVTSIRNVLGRETGNRSVQEIVIGLEQRAQGDKKDLRAIKDTLKVLGDQVAEVVETTKTRTMADAPPPSTIPLEREKSEKEDRKIVQALNEVKERLYTDLPVLVSKLQDIQNAQEKVASSAIVNATSQPAAVPPEDLSKSMDPKLLLDKLEEVKKLCQSPERGNTDDTIKNEVTGLQESLTKLLAIVQEDGNKQTLLAQQQADSVRYLNELNSWLESFVNNGTSQIQGISANIERLCNDLGAGPSRPGTPGARSNLVNDIRQLVAGMKARDQNFASLQAAVHGLLEVLTVSQTQQGADSQAIAGLMERQRHAQEAMFRAFTSEISGEIKGERLRFVDAMKEATAINVQLHVEQFKQELNKEVMAMTEEVGRLHREKQQIENQISDLFSFYSKHKQAEMVPLQFNLFLHTLIAEDS
ncbi:hypothetical protein JR316_0002468 [Psilocybe cubensis]|uniref:Uncharacterized protein n=2 Tax=Psilocybe cubensis TaxID=181762 RepID=A0ACB8HCA4_PSICU|nr:hypothetical protein JR316_0002468 [Psilocybe cubensis]KAH9485558.1 hypothetical protein JR316_0002468 [Psilocybe cubensis]